MHSEPKFYAVTDNSLKQVAPHKVGIRAVLWHNDDGAGRFMQIFNRASANVVLGTTAPTMVLQLGADATKEFPLYDAVFDTAFTFAITTARTGSTGGTASDVIVFVV